MRYITVFLCVLLVPTLVQGELPAQHPIDEVAWQIYLEERLEDLKKAAGITDYIPVILDITSTRSLPSAYVFLVRPGERGIGLNLGLIQRMESRAQVLFVLGHELGHVVEQHALYQTHFYSHRMSQENPGGRVVLKHFITINTPLYLEQENAVDSFSIELLDRMGIEHPACVAADTLKMVAGRLCSRLGGQPYTGICRTRVFLLEAMCVAEH